MNKSKSFQTLQTIMTKNQYEKKLNEEVRNQLQADRTRNQEIQKYNSIQVYARGPAKTSVNWSGLLNQSRLTGGETNPGNIHGLAMKSSLEGF
mmetsp:Transcript_20142/g.30906  ORF Transcript_20142/g.30906 Transcript_20142/m.30906 type:complete len:93 (-) Transcript_20142:1159-1437(-)